MSRIRRKRMHHTIRDNQRKFRLLNLLLRTRARTKDTDQIHMDIINKTITETYNITEEELPGQVILILIISGYVLLYALR